jgi:Protein of unknown function (DUF3106)
LSLRGFFIAPARRALRGALFCAVLAVCTFAAAQSAPSGAAWASLSAQQRAALAPLQRDWPGIDPSRQSKWLEIAARFPTMPADEQRRVQERMAAWARLTPDERGRARLSFQEAKQLPREERQARWEAYQALSPERREALAAKPAPNARPAKADNAAPAIGKRNIVTNPSLAAAPSKPVAPTLMQAKPGATTTLMTEKAALPPHQQTGLPKIAATPGFVDNATLLPKRGPQGAAARSPSPAASKPAR